MKRANVYHVIGVMSGTSMDGLDVAYCSFEKKKKWKFSILKGRTYPYSTSWKGKLSSAHTLEGESLMELHAAYGRYIGDTCRKFVQRYKVGRVDFIASHGHTVFHQPERRFTFQLGEGSSIHAASGLPVICDFRTLDVALGGQGAPLVPVGDKLLFSEYGVCLNLGGIANLSLDIRGNRRAFDICFCNTPLNYLMARVNKSYDKGGARASTGKLLPHLLKKMKQVNAGYHKGRPSLSREMFERDWQPMLDNPGLALNDILRTVCEFIADEISGSIPPSNRSIIVLATGGGAQNTFLVSLLRERMGKRASLVVPPAQIIDFKEALVFAFLGVLRVRNEINALGSVTRAHRDSCTGSAVGF